MIDLYKLNNQVKHYDWGSPDLIPRLMGCVADGTPWAELWMGSHPGSPSWVSLASGEVNLGELIARDPRRFLGNKTAERYGELPFLFKLLAAEKPLSIQAHPNLAQASEGFERENMAGLAPDAHNRSYRDSNHKPEIICALTPFTGMCGFRDPVVISRLLRLFLDRPSVPAIVHEGFVPLLRTLEIPDTASALRGFLSALFGLPPDVRKALTEFILSADDQNDGKQIPLDGIAPPPLPTPHSPLPNYELMQSFARLYPGDPAVIAPLYLNVFHLEPGEAIFLDAGLLHAYVHGFGVELMANSDNVLRGGLTPKHIDIPELMKVLEFHPHEPLIIKPESETSCFIYPAPCDEFSLAVMNGGRADAAIFTPSGPTICIVTEGELIVSDNEESVILKQGESAFIPPTAQLMMQGNYIMYAASVGINQPLG
jgi:mannose-6-phosphate isomerase